MTPEQVELVRTSFAKVEPIANDAVGLFYGRLFETAPEIQPLFANTDMEKQGGMLMAALAGVVASLDNPGQLVPMAQGLGRRHAGYGVAEEHYPAVGAALLWTLEQGLGDQFTPETRDAWTAAYGALSGVMIEAAGTQA
jgi:nitric oxide dioxygenase